MSSPAIDQTGQPSGLIASALVKTYRGRRVVDGVSFSVGPGEVVGLLGPNGAGKTTSFNLVVGLARPDAGRVTLDGRDLSRLAFHQRARAGLGYLPQEASVFRRLSVVDNLLAVLELRDGLDKGERQARAAQLLSEMQLTAVASSLGEQISGGERRRLEVARCLAMEPRLLLFDEPFAGMDPIAVLELQTIIRRLAASGLGVLMTDHNVRETLSICHRAYVLVAGRVMAEGDRETIARDPLARQLYLGESFRL